LKFKFYKDVGWKNSQNESALLSTRKSRQNTINKVLFAVKMEAKRSLLWVALGNTRQSPKAADSGSVANVLFITESSQFTTYDRQTYTRLHHRHAFIYLTPHEWSI
jgi:hypothetical protein